MRLGLAFRLCRVRRVLRRVGVPGVAVVRCVPLHRGGQQIKQLSPKSRRLMRPSLSRQGGGALTVDPNTTTMPI
jgi:hypothetical protein